MFRNASPLALGGPSSYIRAGRQISGAQPQYQPIPFHGGNRGLGGAMLGQSAQEWYNRAKSALSLFDALNARVDRIASPAARLELREWIGHADIDGTPAYRANTVRSDFVHDVAREGVGAYNVERRQSRVEKLEAFNEELKVLVANAEMEYGLLPEPVEEKDDERPMPTIPDLTVPIVAVGGAIAAAILLSSL